LKKIISLILTALAVCFFIASVSGNTELFDSFVGHLAGEDGIDIAELGPGVITGEEACSIRLYI
jgi:hypothetical protein